MHLLVPSSQFFPPPNSTMLTSGNQPWIFTGRTDAEAEAPILWPPDAESWLTGKDPDAGKGWGQEEKGTTEDEMVGWHHCLNGYEFEQALEIMKDREAWRAAVHGVAKSRIQRSEWTTMKSGFLSEAITSDPSTESLDRAGSNSLIWNVPATEVPSGRYFLPTQQATKIL